MNNEEKNVVQEGTTKPSFREKLKKIFNVKNPWMWISLVGIVIIAILIGYIIISSNESTPADKNEKQEQKEEKVLKVIDEEITIDIDSRYSLMDNITFENLKEERITFYVNNNDGIISLEDKEIVALACGTATVYVDYQNLTGKTLLDDEFDVTVSGCEEKKATEIYLFKSLNDNTLSLDADAESYIGTQTLIGTYKCNSNDCKYYDISYYNFTDENADFVIYDDGYYLYNFKTQTRQKVSLTENDEYSSGISYNWGDGTKPLGVTIDKNVDGQTVSAYFSTKEKKITIDYSYGYETISYIPETNVYQATKVISSDDYLWELDILDGKTLEKKKTFDINSPCVGFWYEKHGTQEYYSIDNGACVGISSYQYYTLDFKKINSDFSYNIDFDSAGNLIFIEDGKRYLKYNDSGELVEKGKDYEQVLDVFSEHFFAVKDGYYKLISYKDYKEIAITPYVEGSYYQGHYSGYYDFSDDPSYTEKQPGYYFLISIDPTDEYSENCYEYYYIPETGEVGKFDDVMQCWGYAKPVLYLYPEKDTTKVSVSFEKPWLLTTTYPKFDKVWEVTADKNGDLIDNDGKYYYGLYWEEEGSTPVTFEEGFYVTKDNAIEFLEEKLSIIGLNDRERNEFIMYWLPILEKNEKNLVYFELTEERETYNKLNINPTPDSLLRVAIHVKKVDKKVKIKEQELTMFERVGFTAVEWGGVIH